MNEIYTIGGFDASTVAPDVGTVMPDAATGTAIGAGATFLVIGIYLAVLFSMLVGGVLNYVLQSIALFTIAKNRGMKSAWCAWVPLANAWLLGSVSDLHDRQRGLNRHWGRTLLICKILGPCVFLLGYLGFVAIAIVSAIAGGGDPNTGIMLVGAIAFYLLLFVSIPFYTIAQFGTYVCIYKIFDVVVPEKAVKYIIISLIVPFGCAICMMRARKSMLGVPEELLPEENENEVFTSEPLDQE